MGYFINFLSFREYPESIAPSVKKIKPRKKELILKIFKSSGGNGMKAMDNSVTPITNVFLLSATKYLTN
ncbi:MAG: hypothetical protein QXZ63_02620 [Sulfolobales archaeon]